MADFYEIDFLNVESKRSGDAITIRYRMGDYTGIHVVDGGFQATGEKLVNHIKSYYVDTWYVDNVVATHPDGDHAGGLRTVLESFRVGTLWMFRPWLYAEGMLSYFPRFKSAENLKKRLKEIYPNITALEEIALERNIEIREPVEGAKIGPFTVMSPSLGHYLAQVIESDKTPESIKIEKEDRTSSAGLRRAMRAIVNFVRASWGEEIFSSQETSAENEMSVVQHAFIADDHILLTGDAGRTSLMNAADYAENNGVPLPGINTFQVPHHGSRRNVDTAVLDRWLGTRFAAQQENSTFIAVISASKEDEDHPRRAVVRACIHRGGQVLTTETQSIRIGKNAPERDGWTALAGAPYPNDQEM